ncbi:hypothetical protein GWK26_08590 [haloarchaeon 3A1-DGR]|nr:hypothetical protein GWK26_08590 [haloarchaeon 3A1-DGR]
MATFVKIDSRAAVVIGAILLFVAALVTFPDATTGALTGLWEWLRTFPEAVA